MEQLGPYRTEKKVAVGGMAEIFLARHHGLEGVERTVILKRILPNLADDPEFVTMFLDEARLMASLSHPNIAQVFDLGKVDRRYYLVMEYVRGPSLGALLLAAVRQGELLPRKAALAILLQIAQALQYLHGLRDELGRPLGIVHRDLNPANVMVSYDGAVKLIDFGIAKAAKKVYETRTGVIKGTYGYIAPEQLSSRRGVPIDHRADVFALGILLYECCTGKHPFDASDDPDLLDRILNASYKRPGEVIPDFPSDLDDLIARSLSPYPAGRPDSVAAMITGITTHLADNRWVPTLGDVAHLARRLIPDPEGPVAVRSVSAPSAAIPQFDRRDPTMPVVRPGGRTLRSPVPASGADEEQTVLSAGLASALEDSTREIDVSDLVPVDDVSGVEIEAPSLPQFASYEPEIAGRAPEPANPPLRPELEKAITRWSDRSPSPSRRLALLGSIGVVVAAGWVAFLAARTIGGEVRAHSPEASHASADGDMNRPDRPRILEVVSEPAGARVFVNDHRLREPTPISVELGPEEVDVWLRVTREGFMPQQRRVLSTAGQARFVLVPQGAERSPQP